MWQTKQLAKGWWFEEKDEFHKLNISFAKSWIESNVVLIRAICLWTEAKLQASKWNKCHLETIGVGSQNIWLMSRGQKLRRKLEKRSGKKSKEMSKENISCGEKVEGRRSEYLWGEISRVSCRCSRKENFVDEEKKVFCNKIIFCRKKTTKL